MHHAFCFFLCMPKSALRMQVKGVHMPRVCHYSCKARFNAHPFGRMCRINVPYFRLSCYSHASEIKSSNYHTQEIMRKQARVSARVAVAGETQKKKSIACVASGGLPTSIVEAWVALSAFDGTCTWTADPSETNPLGAHTYGSCLHVANARDLMVVRAYADPVVIFVIKVVGV